MRALVRTTGWALVIGASIGCGGAPISVLRAAAAAPREAPIWVVAPHPDDEALMAAHVIARDAPRAFVHLMTNGDLGCGRDGWQRQRETLSAMRVLGLRTDHVRFLSYPDGWLDELGTVPLGAPERRLEDGSCAPLATTYAHDVHTTLTGRPGALTADGAIGDLAALLARDRPRDVYVSHPFDAHPDHAATYVLLRRAIERAMIDTPPRVHRALVHAGGCWPNGHEPREPCGEAGDSLGTPYPPLPGPLATYTPSEHVEVPDGGALARRAIAEYRSQLHTDVDHDWLGDFGRGESIYWVETLMRDPLHADRLVRTPAPGVPSGKVATTGEARTSGDDTSGDRTVLAIAHRAPLRVTFDARVPEGATASVRVFAATRDACRGYTITSVGDEEIEVRRGCDRVLRRIDIADDGARHARHRWELRVDPRPDEGDVVELELRRDGALLAVLVDTDPFVVGAEVITHASPDAALRGVALSPERR